MLSKDHKNDPKKMHYLRIKAKAKTIVSSCNSFISTIPDCKTNLDTIPDKYDRNYVQEWLSKKQVEGQEDKSLSSWGMELFESDNDMIAILQ